MSSTLLAAILFTGAWAAFAVIGFRIALLYRPQDRIEAHNDTYGVYFSSLFTTARNQYDYIKRVASAEEHWLCGAPWSMIWVTSAGEIRTCCLNDTSFGNLFDQSFDEIWQFAQPSAISLRVCWSRKRW